MTWFFTKNTRKRNKNTILVDKMVFFSYNLVEHVSRPDRSPRFPDGEREGAKVPS